MNYAVLYSSQNQIDKAFEYFQQSLQEGYKYEDIHIDIINDPALQVLRDQTLRWDALMKKYFPDDK